uniref:Thyroglobulin type-1 domain-containing protein n=1 Tax=Steinernema glaseri TaxID=37863 RepID=A0A1I8A9I5_9BILA
MAKAKEDDKIVGLNSKDASKERRSKGQRGTRNNGPALGPRTPQSFFNASKTIFELIMQQSDMGCPRVFQEEGDVFLLRLCWSQLQPRRHPQPGRPKLASVYPFPGSIRTALSVEAGVPLEAATHSSSPQKVSEWIKGRSGIKRPEGREIRYRRAKHKTRRSICGWKDARPRCERLGAEEECAEMECFGKVCLEEKDNGSYELGQVYCTAFETFLFASEKKGPIERVDSCHGPVSVKPCNEYSLDRWQSLKSY